MFGWWIILFAIIFIGIGIYSPIDKKKEITRLDTIVEEIEKQIEDGEYKYALMNAEGLVYSGSIRNDEQSRRWRIEREYWIDKIIEEAEKDGIILERPVDKGDENEQDKSKSNDTKERLGEEHDDAMNEVQENINAFFDNVISGRIMMRKGGRYLYPG